MQQRGVTMPASLRLVTTSRRILLVAITALVATLAVSFSAPQEAHAFRDPTALTSSHQGWVYVRQGQGPCPASPIPEYCDQPELVDAWRWSGSSWSRAHLVGGEQVYAYPYSGSWHWAWTQRTGWLAIQTAKLDTGYRCTGYACPRF